MRLHPVGQFLSDQRNLAAFAGNSRVVGPGVRQQLGQARWLLRVSCRHARALLPARRLPSSAAVAAAAASEVGQDSDASSALQHFLGWAVANGVEGIGQPDSKVAIFEGEHGERGLACLQDLERGELVLWVPLRLAITEHPADEESNALCYAGAPWSVRLAAKLLRMCRAGAACPWQPYLQVLPAVVPSPHSTFSWEQLQEIQYEPMLRDFDYATWVATSARRQLSVEASGGAGGERLEWALAIVHSRSFGSPGEGGATVRMLVPVVDMLNHAGYEYYPGGTGGLMGAAAPRDNVRWDVVAPGEREGGEWGMKVTATRDIQVGEELLLSYGERGNDSFFQHYGFVPPRNPHDDVTLFDDIQEGIDWLGQALAHQALTGQLAFQPSPASLAAALEAATRYSPPLGPQPAATSQAESEVMSREAARVKLLGGGRLDGRLMAAFEALATAGAAGAGGEGGGEQQQWGGSGSAAAIEARQRAFHAVIALRCQEVLEGRPTSLLEDLERLAAWEEEGGGSGGSEGHGFGGMLQQYRTDIEAYCTQSGSTLGDPFSSRSRRGGGGSTGGAGGAAALGEQGAGSSSSSSEGPIALVDAGAAALEEGEALLRLLRQLSQQQASTEAAGVDEAGVAAHAAAVCEGSSMLPVVYRAYKKMIMWDAILAAACVNS